MVVHNYGPGNTIASFHAEVDGSENVFLTHDVIDTVEKLHRERGITALTITHHMNEAARADRIIVLDDGRVLLDGTPQQVFSEPDVLRAAGLDVPQSSALIHALREQGIALDGKLDSVQACVETICRAYHANA